MRVLRAENAVVTYVTYLAKTAWPAPLVFYYAHPAAVPWVDVAIAGSILAAITTAAVVLRSRYPFVLVGWLWYAGTLVPVILTSLKLLLKRAQRFLGSMARRTENGSAVSNERPEISTGEVPLQPHHGTRVDEVNQVLCDPQISPGQVVREFAHSV